MFFVYRFKKKSCEETIEYLGSVEDRKARNNEDERKANTPSSLEYTGGESYCPLALSPVLSSDSSLTRAGIFFSTQRSNSPDSSGSGHSSHGCPIPFSSSSFASVSSCVGMREFFFSLPTLFNTKFSLLIFISLIFFSKSQSQRGSRKKSRFGQH